MTRSRLTRVVVLHRDCLVDEGLAATLGRPLDMEVVETRPVHGCQDMAAWLAAEAVDVVVTDHDRGVSLAQALRRSEGDLHTRQPRIVVVAAWVLPVQIRFALRHGVSGYMLVDSPSNEVVDAVRKVRTGLRHVSEPLARGLLEDMLSLQLTPRETQVLHLAARGLANKVIASHLQVELATIKCHMKAVMSKLNASNRTEAVVLASQRGLLTIAADAASDWASLDHPPARPFAQPQAANA